MRGLVVIAFCLAGGACASTINHHEAYRDQFVTSGLPKVEFDFNCPRERLTYTQLTVTTFGVRGCGQQARYEFVQGVGWVSDGARTTDSSATSAPSTSSGPPGGN